MTAIEGARYAHTNLVAVDADRLIRFYVDVFGCVPVPPARDLSGAWLERGTGVPGARLTGQHLRLPGHGEAGPTLEIFQYEATVSAPPPPANRVGYGHLAFAVPDVEAAVEAVIAAGGGPAGEIVSHEVPGAGPLVFTYVRDPEGNLVELQRWG